MHFTIVINHLGLFLTIKILNLHPELNLHQWLIHQCACVVYYTQYDLYGTEWTIKDYAIILGHYSVSECQYVCSKWDVALARKVPS